MRDALTTQSRRFMPETVRHHVDALLACDKEREKLLTHLVRLIFPSGSRHIGAAIDSPDDVERWQRERRVADDTFFDLYFERVHNDGVSAVSNAERAVQLFTEPEKFDAFLGSLDQKPLQDALATMGAIADQYSHDQAQAVSVVLLNRLPQALDGALLGGITITSNHHVARMLSKLLLTVQVEEDRERVARAILNAVTTRSAQWR